MHREPVESEWLRAFDLCIRVGDLQFASSRIQRGETAVGPRGENRQVRQRARPLHFAGRHIPRLPPFVIGNRRTGSVRSIPTELRRHRPLHYAAGIHSCERPLRRTAERPTISSASLPGHQCAADPVGHHLKGTHRKIARQGRAQSAGAFVEKRLVSLALRSADMITKSSPMLIIRSGRCPNGSVQSRPLSMWYLRTTK